MKLTSLFTFCLCLIAITTTATAQKKPNPAFAKVTDVEGLPRVLLIGDSISIGYTVDVQKMLKGQANVHRIPTNGGPTTRGLQNIDSWLGEKPWDVIHFNWGLHDLKYMNEKGTLVAVEKGKQQVAIEDYEANLEKLVQRLQKTNAELVWRNTTPVPVGSVGRIPGDEVKYNAVAQKVMDKHNIVIEDMHTFAASQLEKIQRKANVHFTTEGSQVLATHAVEAIQAAIKRKISEK